MRASLMNTSAMVHSIAEQGSAEIKSVSAADGDAAVLHDAENIPEEINTLLKDLVQKSEDVKLGPVSLYHALDAANLLDQFPRVGSTHKDDPKPNKSETYIGKDEEGKAQERNYFSVWFRDTPIGMTWADRIEALSDVGNANEERLNEIKEEYPDVYEHRNDSRWINDEKALFNQKLGTGRQIVRKCVQIRDVMDVLANHEDAVTVRWNTYKDADGNIKMRRTKYPFMLVDSKDAMQLKPLSLGDFLKFGNKDVIAKAIEKGGNFTAFGDAIRRTTPPGGTPEKGGAFKIDSIDKLGDMARAIASWLDDKEPDGSKHKAVLLTELMKPANDELVLAIGSVVMELDGVWPKIEGRYNRLVAANEKASGQQERKAG